MPSPAEVRSLGASLNGGDQPVESVVLSSQVDTFPKADAYIHYIKVGDTPAVVKPASVEVVEQMGILQGQRLAGRSEPDFLLEADDGDSTIEFKGYLAAPTIDSSPRSTVNKVMAVGEASLLDTMDLSIYDASYGSARASSASLNGPALNGIAGTADGDIPKLAKAVTEALVSNLNFALDRAESDEARALIQNQHAINQDALPIWYELLNASDVVFERISDLLNKSAVGVGARITQLVKEALTNSTPGFWSNIRTLMAHFPMYYIPELAGAGRLARADTKVADPQGSIDVSVEKLSVLDGSTKILPVGGVIMRGSGYKADRASSNDAQPRVVAFYPVPLLPGYIHKEPTPTWLLDSTGYALIDTEVGVSTADSQAPNLSLSGYASKKSSVIDYFREIGKSSSGVMSELCEVLFKEMQLNQSSGSVDEPLNLARSEDLGRRVTINIGGGGSFTAFITKVVHRLHLQNGKELSTYTSVDFSHIKYE